MPGLKLNRWWWAVIGVVGVAAQSRWFSVGSVATCMVGHMPIACQYVTLSDHDG